MKIFISTRRFLNLSNKQKAGYYQEIKFVI